MGETAVCEWHEPQKFDLSSFPATLPPRVDLDKLMPYAKFLADQGEMRRTAAGFYGYGLTKPGDRVLVAVDTHYDLTVVESICRVLRDRGAHVDLIVTEAEPDREFDELDEIRASIRDKHWDLHPRRWEGIAWIEQLAEAKNYDLLVHGKGGPTPPTPYRYEGIPWLRQETFAHRNTLFPRDVHVKINERAWRTLWENAKGGKVHLSDPEGTDLWYSVPSGYYDKDIWPMFNQPWWGHLFCHPPTPILEEEECEGVVAGTLNHFSRPYPCIRVHVKDSKVVGIEGGGKFGEGWRRLIEETKDIQYPLVPRRGLFWFIELGLGTNPLVARPSDITRLSTGGTEWERNRSGVLHAGFGTMWRSPAEKWAIEHGHKYGHLHVHMLFATLEVVSPSGDRFKVVDHGHLTALDDPEVRSLAAQYGNPDELLTEAWTPYVPGITAPGRYEDYAKDPASWVYRLRA